MISDIVNDFRYSKWFNIYIWPNDMTLTVTTILGGGVTLSKLD